MKSSPSIPSQHFEHACYGILFAMRKRIIRVTREAFRERAALDTAVSRALLRQVARGDEPETLRIYTPADVVAFGPQDTRAPRYADAAAFARAAGFEAIERLAGGRAAVFHCGTIAFSWTMPDTTNPRGDVMARFDETADIMVRALRSLGIDARVGEVAGEYCPGQHSVNARGERKLMGVGQRLIRGAAHVGGVVVISGGDRIRDVLMPVYDALGVDWRPETVGSVEDEAQGAAYDTVAQAILDEFAARFTLYDGKLSPRTLQMAETLEDEHLAPSHPS